MIDVNANPDVDFHEDFARSARADGHPPTELLQRLLDLGLRYRPHWVGWQAGGRLAARRRAIVASDPES